MRSPAAPSIRPTGGKYLSCLSVWTGKTACSRGYSRVQSVLIDGGGGVRGVAQRAVLHGEVAVGHLVDLGADGDHRRDEAVDLARSSDSVGSTIRVPATGNARVGAWKP